MANERENSRVDCLYPLYRYLLLQTMLLFHITQNYRIYWIESHDKYPCGLVVGYLPCSAGDPRFESSHGSFFANCYREFSRHLVTYVFFSCCEVDVQADLQLQHHQDFMDCINTYKVSPHDLKTLPL